MLFRIPYEQQIAMIEFTSLVHSLLQTLFTIHHLEHHNLNSGINGRSPQPCVAKAHNPSFEDQPPLGAQTPFGAAKNLRRYQVAVQAMKGQGRDQTGRIKLVARLSIWANSGRRNQRNDRGLL